MITKKSLILFVTVVALAGLSSALTFSLMSRLNRHPESTNGIGGNFHNWAHRIDLTKEQKNRLEPLEADLKKDLEKIQPELAAARIQVCSALSQSTVDEKQLEALVSQITDLEREQQRHVVHHLFGMKEILTPEQRQAFFTMIMQSVCEECRNAIGSKKDLCGHCKIASGLSAHNHKG